MPKKGSSRRRFTLRKVRVSPRQALTTLASNIAVTGALTAAADGAYRLMSVKGSWGITELAATEGPITVGYAHSDYSVTEIKECLEAAAAISIGDKVAQEQANRLVRVVGVLNGGDDQLNDGKPISTKLNWLISIGDNVNIFAYNDGSDALTTGANVTLMGDAWIKDSS